jgi:hypothetical protein
MIQRSQSLWLLIAAIFAFLSLQFPFFSGSIGEVAASDFKGTSYVPITILTSGLGLLSLITIFMYKNRKQQLWLTVLAFVMSAAIIALYFTRIREFTSGSISIWAIFTFAVPLLLVMAMRGIYRDIRLIKSLDRLR